MQVLDCSIMFNFNELLVSRFLSMFPTLRVVFDESTSTTPQIKQSTRTKFLFSLFFSFIIISEGTIKYNQNLNQLNHINNNLKNLTNPVV